MLTGENKDVLDSLRVFFRNSVAKFLQFGSGATPLITLATPAMKVYAEKSTPATNRPPKLASTTGHHSGEK